VLDTRYITGLGTADDQMVILLDIERLMAGADMGLIETTLH
jgi:chemotaxis signal transduction protein